jgi:primosomal protein N' (replication factor Y)
MLPLPIEAGTYDYRLPPELEAQPGSFVVVPLGGREAIGVVWDGDPDPMLPAHRLKNVQAVLDAPPMGESLRRFVEWVAAYTISPPGSVLRMAMSAPAALEPSPQRAGWQSAPGAIREELKLTPARRRVLDLLGPGEVRGATDLAEAAGVSPGVVRGLADAGLLVPALLPRGATFPLPDPDHPGPVLMPDQAAAAAALTGKVAARDFGVTLLTGVTGSGKTEVYLDAVAEALRRAARRWCCCRRSRCPRSGWTLPPPLRRRPGAVAFRVSSRTRRDTWRAVAEGAAPVVVGARSALFLPYPDLGLLIVDEEHETAFKQEDGVIYHARDMAVVRARLAKAACVLVSATPSLETLNNAETGRYDHLHLAERHGSAGLPSVDALDLRRDPPERGRFLSPLLIEAVRDTLARGEQAMLFLNRRGYAPLTLCRHCGHRMRCPNCTAWLVEHRAQRRLQCHHCGHAEPPPAECPECATPTA